MMRRTPMKPGKGFARPTFKPAPRAPAQRGRMATMGPAETRPAPKEDALQHAGYMALVRKLPCRHCGITGYTQFCHSDEGKGGSIKSDCRYGWPGCGPRTGIPGCHALIGTLRIYPKEQRRELEAGYSADTRGLIERMGLWPDDLPRLETP